MAFIYDKLTGQPRYVPMAIFTIGICSHGHKNPYYAINIKADTQERAMKQAREILKPSIVQSIIHFETMPNPEYYNHFKEDAK